MTLAFGQKCWPFSSPAFLARVLGSLYRFPLLASAIGQTNWLPRLAAPAGSVSSCFRSPAARFRAHPLFGWQPLSTPAAWRFLCGVSMLRFYVTFLCDVSMWRFRLTLLFGVPVWCVDNAFADGVISPTGRAPQKTTPQKTTPQKTTPQKTTPPKTASQRTMPLRLYFIDKLSMLFEIGKKPFLL